MRWDAIVRSYRSDEAILGSNSAHTTVLKQKAINKCNDVGGSSDEGSLDKCWEDKRYSDNKGPCAK